MPFQRPHAINQSLSGPGKNTSLLINTLRWSTVSATTLFQLVPESWHLYMSKKCFVIPLHRTSAIDRCKLSFPVESFTAQDRSISCVRYWAWYRCESATRLCSSILRVVIMNVQRYVVIDMYVVGSGDSVESSVILPGDLGFTEQSGFMDSETQACTESYWLMLYAWEIVYVADVTRPTQSTFFILFVYE
jgi:hypothetical protein